MRRLLHNIWFETLIPYGIILVWNVSSKFMVRRCVSFINTTCIPLHHCKQHIYIYKYIGMALFVRGHRWPPNPPVAPQSTGGPLKNRWPLQILAHSFGRILRHLYFTNIWNKLTLTTVYTHTETFMGTSHSLNVYRRKDHSMKNIFHKNGSLF